MTPEERAKQALLPQARWSNEGTIDLAKLHEIIASAIREAVEAETERCTKVVTAMADSDRSKFNEAHQHVQDNPDDDADWHAYGHSANRLFAAVEVIRSRSERP